MLDDEAASMATSSFSIATNILTSPNEAFAAIKNRPNVFLPLLVLLAGYWAVSFTYMNAVDLPWFMDAQLQSRAATMTEAQLEQAATAAAEVSPWFYGAVGAVTTTLVVLLWMFITSVYYTGISFVTNDGIKLKQWFALVCWCALPTAFGLIAQLANLTVNDARFMLQDEINPLSFGTLFTIDRAGATFVQRILLGIDVTALWSLVISVIGYQLWTGASMVKAGAIVLGPLTLIVVIGSLVTLF
jgi:hypothetical protein